MEDGETTGRSARDRMTAAAFSLFAERGFDSTTIEDITRLAGVGRTTFFRTFGSKEDVVFPDHEDLLARIEARLAASGPDSTWVALGDAAAIVLEQYLGEGEVARLRYGLTSVVPALREREIASAQRYRLVFKRFLRDLLGDTPRDALRADLIAAAIVTAHNHVLLRWLRGETSTPQKDLTTALGAVTEAFGGTSSEDEGTTVVVLRSGQGIETLLPRLRSALSDSPD
ncbi:TetR family transcriptional regulator [Nocardioides stalactiti]|uniref:TetR family transcriptional regulator n=1 Tax=Nocardioides stalactiti TaxID=2755356 RepID=UPI0028ACED64|nr:TetR family transcriptional regulator [Nocardioides stalactiti]